MSKPAEIMFENQQMKNFKELAKGLYLDENKDIYTPYVEELSSTAVNEITQ